MDHTALGKSLYFGKKKSNLGEKAKCVDTHTLAGRAFSKYSV